MFVAVRQDQYKFQKYLLGLQLDYAASRGHERILKRLVQAETCYTVAYRVYLEIDQYCNSRIPITRSVVRPCGLGVQGENHRILGVTSYTVKSLKL